MSVLKVTWRAPIQWFQNVPMHSVQVQSRKVKDSRTKIFWICWSPLSRPGPVLASAGPNARPRRGASRSSSVITPSCSVFLMKIFKKKNNYMNLQKDGKFIGVDPVTDLRIGQIGHGLGSHATLSYDDSILTKNLRNYAEA